MGLVEYFCVVLGMIRAQIKVFRFPLVPEVVQHIQERINEWLDAQPDDKIVGKDIKISQSDSDIFVIVLYGVKE